METEYKVGQNIQIVDDFNGHNRFVIAGVVERLTKTQIVVKDRYGNQQKFHKKNSQLVGYSWPMLTHVIKPAISSDLVS